MRPWIVALGFTACMTALPASAQSVDLRAVGDSAFVGGNGQYGPPPDGWVARNLKDLEPLRSPDVNFMNLEAALAPGCRDFVPKEFMFAVAPEALVQFGRWGFNLVGLANNHGLDCNDRHDLKAFQKTFAELMEAVPGLALHGVAATPVALIDTPAIIAVHGLRIGMVAIKAWEGGHDATIGNLDNRHAIFRALRDAPVDIRILSLHGGVESARIPHTSVIAVAREFVNRYGGDLVLAHHPHVMQGFELLKKSDGRFAAVFFSLGNHLHNGLSDRGDGLMAKVTLTKSGLDPDQVFAFPLANSSTRPGPLPREELPTILSMLRASSASVATRALPGGLTRVPFTLEAVDLPATGLHLVGAKTLPVTQSAKAGGLGPASSGKSWRQGRVARDPSMPPGWTPIYIPPAKWIPPPISATGIDHD